MQRHASQDILPGLLHGIRRHFRKLLQQFQSLLVRWHKKADFKGALRKHRVGGARITGNGRATKVFVALHVAALNQNGTGLEQIVRDLPRIILLIRRQQQIEAFRSLCPLSF